MNMQFQCYISALAICKLFKVAIHCEILLHVGDVIYVTHHSNLLIHSTQYV